MASGACGVAGWQSLMVPESDGSRACHVSESSPRDSFLRFCRGLIPSSLVQSRSAAESPSPWNPLWGPHGVAAAVVQVAGGYGTLSSADKWDPGLGGEAWTGRATPGRFGTEGAPGISQLASNGL